MDIDTDLLGGFLARAHKSTYANKDAAKAKSSREKSEDYHYQEGNWEYHDTYFGGKDFIGEEIIYQNGNPIWGMNYYGYLLDEGIQEKDVYNFLRTALMQDYTDIPSVRGPLSFQIEPRKYENRVDGNLARLGGTETISFAQKEIYRCWYHGGLIQ